VKSPGQTTKNQNPQQTTRQPREPAAQIYKLAHTKLETAKNESHNGNNGTSL